MSFTEGQTYSREAIHDALGGELISFLPQRGQQIVCGCFDPKLNPSAPAELLVGDAPKVQHKAELLIEQRTAIPVFLKRGINRWEYVGSYRVTQASRDPARLEHRRHEAGRKTPVTAILSLERV